MVASAWRRWGAAVALCGVALLFWSGKGNSPVKPPVRVTITFVCTGGYATTYHADKECPALKSCRGTVKIWSLETAKKRGRRPCALCAEETK